MQTFRNIISTRKCNNISVINAYMYDKHKNDICWQSGGFHNYIFVLPLYLKVFAVDVLGVCATLKSSFPKALTMANKQSHVAI
jgi:hypothetical protein